MSTARLDKPWRRPGAFRYALRRLAGMINPPVTVTESRTPMIIERDVPVIVRDGCVLRVNCYRPPTDEPVAVIMCTHPYGKDRLPTRRGRRAGYSFQYRVLRQTGPVSFSTLTSWEAPDPDWWVGQGYAVINCDLRGAGTSEGVAELLAEQEGEDICDLIEWAAAQPWSSGKIGLLGVSYLALTQWRAASLQPPSLAAICPWEGFTDAYRDLMRPGGIPETGFLKLWARGMRAVRQPYSIIDRQKAHPLRDGWWRSLVPDCDQITVPTLVCGSFSDNNLHSRGSFRGFQMIKSTERHLYTHRAGKWATFYADEARQAQLSFFDQHLRGYDRPRLPTVRLEVRADRDTITAVREETAWPLPQTRWTDLYLDAAGLQHQPATVAGRLSFPVAARGLSFGYAFPADIEVTGPMTAHLWVELQQTDDADLFVGIEKWDGKRYVPFEGSYGFGRDRVTTGWQRISLRSLTPDEPADYTTPRPLGAGEIAPVTVDLGPSATHFSAGQSLRLVIAGRWLWPRNPLTGQFPAAYRPLGSGHCCIHWGPDQPSRLVIPVNPG